MKATRHLVRGLILALFAAAPLFGEAELFVVDKPHTSVTFRIRHVVSMVEGRFTDYDGKIWIDRQNPSASKVEFQIQSASINTGNENRDKHLRSADFFDVEKFSTIDFVSTKVTPKANDAYDVTGNFTMRGVTKTMTVPVRHGGFAKVGKADKTGFDLTIRLNRKDFNINWNRAIDQGGWLLGDDVDIIIGIEANKQVEEPAKAASNQVPTTP